MSNALAGVHDVLWGLGFVAKRPRLWRWMIAPVVLSAMVLVGIIAAAVPLLRDGADALSAWLPSWMSWLGSVAAPLMFIATLLAGYFLFFVVVAVLTAPFCEMLSEDVEAELRGASPAKFSLVVFVRELVRGIGHGLRRVMVYIVTLAALFVLGMVVPVFGTMAAAILGVVVSARFAAYDSLDAVWARKNWTYARKMQFLRHNRARSYGLGFAVAGLVAIPIINLVALPLGAAGATRQALAVDNNS